MKDLGTHLRSVALVRMRNKAMAHKLMKGKALDVRSIGSELEPGVFLLSRFREGVDYCDAKTEGWIRSIGRHRKTREIHAATDARFYLNGDYECLWLR